MEEFIDFLGFLNPKLRSKDLPRLESFLMPANFSSSVGEFMNLRIPEQCNDLVKNQCYNSHPDLIPVNRFSDDAIQFKRRYRGEGFMACKWLARS
ncbi:MAG: hypothetical protein M2R45_03910 [Verrucomicrobia subdivision 3 bacterium]|nr:hypothetical protein [Limisphaerales bacterium]MCS1417509.1 hypothetical protein [Limisphaerales bacterium]